MVWFILISLLALGVVLVLVEVLFIPGTTIIGALGVLVTGLGIYYGFVSFETNTALTITGLSLLAHVVIIIYGFRSGVWNRFSLKETITSRSYDDRLAGLKVGQTGRTISDFRPYGKVEIGERIYEAKSEVGFLSAGTQVIIERLEDNKITINKA